MGSGVALLAASRAPAGTLLRAAALASPWNVNACASTTAACCGDSSARGVGARSSGGFFQSAPVEGDRDNTDAAAATAAVAVGSGLRIDTENRSGGGSGAAASSVGRNDPKASREVPGADPDCSAAAAGAALPAGFRTHIMGAQQRSHSRAPESGPEYPSEPAH